jgi:DNA-binding NtrC family response regulator
MAERPAEILIVDDDESLRRVTSYHLEKAGYAVRAAATGDEALALLEAGDLPPAARPDVDRPPTIGPVPGPVSAGGPPDLIVTDVRMPGMSGLQLLQRVKARWPQLGVVVITAHGSVEDAVEAMRLGAHDYLVKPFDHQALLLTVQKGLRYSRLLRENERLREVAAATARFETLIGASEALRSVIETAAQVAPRQTTVLILGESGTGKELLARGIHLASSRADGPFVAVNVGGLPEGLIDSELFGHVKGAFTGAVGDRKGRFELAHGGTLFLDEIGELRLDLQVKLLRALQEGEIERVGGTSAVGVDVRVIAATNRDLEAMVADGEFRVDLYYRIAVVPLHLPPLRDRRDDLPLLIRHFLEGFARAGKGRAPHRVVTVSDAAQEALARYRWPGNVRELQNVLERALVLHPEGPIELADLPERIRRPQPQAPGLLGELPEEGVDLEQLEKELIRRALDKCGGNQSRTARYLGITRNTLLYRLEKYGLKSGKGGPEAELPAAAREAGPQEQP